MSTEYHKINSIQKRHTSGTNKGKFTGEWADPVFEYLQDLPWICREKIDGTNIRIEYTRPDPETVARRIDGRTDNAQIPAPLYKKLEEYFPADCSNLEGVIDLPNREDCSITLYGEGFGAGIQKGGGYGPVDFILFDVKVGDTWLHEESITGIAKGLGIQRVGIYTGITTLRQAIDTVRQGRLTSHFWPGIETPEGIVATPAVPLRNCRGSRIIAKVKAVDFAQSRPLNDFGQAMMGFKNDS
jgi:hypothetical protein